MEKFIFKPQQVLTDMMKKSEVYTGEYLDIKMYDGVFDFAMSGRGNYAHCLPMQAVPGIEDGAFKWRVAKTATISLSEKSRTGILTLLEGEHYQESDKGLSMKLKSGATKIISNVRIRILRQVNCYYDEQNFVQKLICSVFCTKWQKAKEFIIAKEEYSNFFAIIKKKFPEITLMTNGRDSISEYLSNVYAEAKESWKEEVEFVRRGWFQLDDKVKFAVGTDRYYNTAPIPNVGHLSKIEKQEIYKEGCAFLNVGNSGSEISIMFLFAHLGFSAYWFEKGGLACRFCLYLIGPSGSLKTSTANLLTNVFETDLSKKNLRFNATEASVTNIFDFLKDTTMLVDDYSSTESETKRHSTTLMEKIIRIVGDGVIPSKMGIGKVIQRKLRAAIMMTGEDVAGLAESSVLRCINLTVDKNTFSGSYLAKYQRGEGLRKYFALYILFLEECGDQMKTLVEERLTEFREKYVDIPPRLKDAAIIFEVQAMFIVEYGRWLGIEEVTLLPLLGTLNHGLQDIIRKNDEERKILSLDQMFLIGLTQSFGSYPNTDLAENELIYAEAESSYLGFKESDTGYIWVDFERTFSLVKNYWKAQGTTFLKSQKKVKECLLQEELIKYKKDESGTEYLLRAKKGTRRRMLVLSQKKMLDKMKSIKL